MADFNAINEDSHGEGVQSARNAEFKIPKETISTGHIAPDYMANDIRPETVSIDGGSPLPIARLGSTHLEGRTTNPAAIPHQPGSSPSMSFTKRVDEAVASGQATVAHAAQLPSQSRLIALFEDNHRAGRPLFEGVKAYRGAKDPDVDAGTFDAKFKHATPVFEMARGYAETANANIGLASKQTRGLGMLGEYELPRSTVFHKNFSVEDEARHSKGLTIREAEQQLRPLVAEYSGASTPEQKDVAARKIDGFTRTHLYEISLPADQKPSRQWVVQHDPETDRGRLLVHQDHGPLADVMIDVVKERKAAIDEHSAQPISKYIARGGDAGMSELETFSPGIQKSLATTSQHIDAKLASLRREAADVKHASLSDAIAWRKRAHQDTRVSRLTNSGSLIEHGDPVLKSIPQLERSLREVEEGARRQRELPQQTEVLQTLKGGHGASVALDRQRGQVRNAAEEVAQASAHFDTLKNARDKALEDLEGQQSAHSAKLNGGLVSRSFYKLRDAKEAVVQMRSAKSGISELDEQIEGASERWRHARSSLSHEESVAANLTSKLKQFEGELQSHKEEERLGSIPARLFEKTHNLSSREWGELAAAGKVSLAESQAKIAAGLEEAKLFNEVAAKGIEAGVAHSTQSRPIQRKSGQRLQHSIG